MSRKNATVSSAQIRDAARQADLPGTAGPDERVSLREHAADLVASGKFAKMSRALAWIASETKIARGTLHRNVVLGVPLSVPIANTLAAWSKGRISASKTAGVAL